MNENDESQDETSAVAQNSSSSTRITSPLPETHAGHPQRQSRSKARKGGVAGFLTALMLMLGMLLGGAGATAANAFSGSATAVAANTTTSSAATVATTSASQAQTVAEVTANTISAIYEQTSASVVMISAVVTSSTGRSSSTGEAIGSGIVLDTNGSILTNYHVIEDATSIKIEFTDGSEYTATVVGTAPQDDLAVIKTTAPAAKLVPATLGDSSTVQSGDEVITIGYPYGLDQSVSAGIVSGLDRQASGDSGRTLSGLIQTDAAINPGNSGGPLLNANGEVIGVNTMIESPVEGFTGVGLSIPINNAKSIITQLEAGETVQRAWLGISGADVDASVQTEYNLSVSQGVIVMDVTSGGPAAQAGLQATTTTQSGFGQAQSSQIDQIGDIIVSIDGKQVTSVADITTYLNSKQPGDTVSLGIVRNGQQQSVTVTLQTWPSATSSTTASSNS